MDALINTKRRDDPNAYTFKYKRRGRIKMGTLIKTKRR